MAAFWTVFSRLLGLRGGRTRLRDVSLLTQDCLPVLANPFPVLNLLTFAGKRLKHWRKSRVWPRIWLGVLSHPCISPCYWRRKPETGSQQFESTATFIVYPFEIAE